MIRSEHEMVERNGGIVNGGMVEYWWNGGIVEWWNIDGMVE